MSLKSLIKNSAFQNINIGISFVGFFIVTCISSFKLISFLNYYLLKCYKPAINKITKSPFHTGAFAGTTLECHEGMQAPGLESIFTYIGYVTFAIFLGYWGSFVSQLRDYRREIDEKVIKEKFLLKSNFLGTIEVIALFQTFIFLISYGYAIFDSFSSTRVKFFSILLFLMNLFLLFILVSWLTRSKD